MRTDKNPFTPDQLVSLHDHIAAFQTLMSGSFDARISELKKTLAEVDEKVALLGSVDKIKQMKQDADDYVAEAEEVVSTKHKILNDRENALIARENALNDREASIKADSDALMQSKQEHEGMVATTNHGIAKRAAELDKLEAKLKAEDSRLQAMANNLNQQKIALDEKVQKIRQSTVGL